LMVDVMLRRSMDFPDHLLNTSISGFMRKTFSVLCMAKKIDVWYGRLVLHTVSQTKNQRYLRVILRENLFKKQVKIHTEKTMDGWIHFLCRMVFQGHCLSCRQKNTSNSGATLRITITGKNY